MMSRAGEDAAEMDMMPDVIVGRIVIDTGSQASNYVYKLITFETGFESNERMRSN